ncbi:hypothetical protein [Comamonas thiooxydans]|uniref:hypothetical protein n=1 Tax=Comamonas thiooxydans TaxID=363952 RepID=UPI003D029CEF
MKFNPKLAIVYAAATLATSAFALTPAEHSAEKDRISAEYKAAKEQCKTLKSNAKDVCEEQAKGVEKVASAELKYKVEPNEKNQFAVAKAKADADYGVAKEKCDDFSGNSKDVCQKDAKAAHVKALESAKVSEIRKDPSAKPGDIANARKDASEKTMEADYKAAKQRCDPLSGDAKDACIADAKRRFGQ